MPGNTIMFLRHAETKVDSEIPSSKWNLSVDGYDQAVSLLEDKKLNEVQIIISSTEKKAIDTVKPLAEKLDIEINIFTELKELNRDKGEFSTLREYYENVKSIFDNPEIVVNNWETASKALERFSSKIREIDCEHSNKKILIVSHGIVLNLYFAAIRGENHLLYQRWMQKKFCDYGIIEDGTVVKDIASLQQEIYEPKSKNVWK